MCQVVEESKHCESPSNETVESMAIAAVSTLNRRGPRPTGRAPASANACFSLSVKSSKTKKSIIYNQSKFLWKFYSFMSKIFKA